MKVFAWILRIAGVLSLAAACVCAWAAAGAETYKYDARGRLIQVNFPDGSTIKYTYDGAGNRQTVGPAPGGPAGTIAYSNAQYPNGCASCTGTFWIDIANSGAGTLTTVSFSLLNAGLAGCTATSSGGASLAPGQIVRFTWYKASSATAYCGPKVTAGNATNSPKSWSTL